MLNKLLLNIDKTKVDILVDAQWFSISISNN